MRTVRTILLALAFLAGLSLLLYPTLSDWWNSSRQTRVVSEYDDSVSRLAAADQAAMLEEAAAFNERLLTLSNRFVPTDEDTELYESLLNVTATGIMGYIEIPSLEVVLPIYHGTSDEVLQVAVGHVEGSSLPVGGASTHSVLSGHRGLPGARLFTDLDELAVGDYFLIHIMDETLTYEVDQKVVVDPDDLEELQIVEGEDLCTLVTCTPYGVNTHRLLVRGHRVENTDELIQVDADAEWVDPLYEAPFVALPAVSIMMARMLATTSPARNRRKKEQATTM